MSTSIPSTNKNPSKKMNSSRDKNKSVESGGSSQCETPPLADKDAGPSQGRFAGIGIDSVQCMADQIGVEFNTDAATNLAEDVSYKLRQVISTIALHSEMMKKTRVDSWDVNTVLTLSDTSPVIGASPGPYVPIGDEKLCCQYENLLNITDIAMTTQTCVYTTPPTASVEWITDDNSLSSSNNISIFLQNYYTKVARAILNLKKKPKEVAVEDLATNTRIGPIFPNLFNLAVLVLNDDNLNALNVPAKKPLQSNVLDMVDALCSNPCSLDTNIQQQFQRLFPVMVSNILGNGSLAEKMVAILTKITRTWPSFISIGKGTLFDYLSQGTKERLTAPMIKCVMALGRQALVECLGDHLDHIDECIHAPRKNHLHTDLRETILDATSILLKSEPTTYLEDYVVTDYTLYDMLGDSILPRRIIFPLAKKSKNGETNSEKTAEEEFPYLPLRPVTRRSRFRLITTSKTNSCIHRDTLFEHSSDSLKRNIRIKIKGCRTKDLPIRNGNIVMDRNQMINSYPYNRTNSVVVVASGLLNRFRYRLSEPRSAMPIYGALTL